MNECENCKRLEKEKTALITALQKLYEMEEIENDRRQRAKEILKNSIGV